jgi:XTP/dITP diphosphohydrolase
VTEVVLATRSAGKLRELAPMLRAAGFEPRLLGDVGVVPTEDEEGIEVFDTFAQNARAKAAYFHARCGGRPVLAEDSGLVVPALGGVPGVWSKRFSGRRELAGEALDAANNDELLQRLEGVSDRRAWYESWAVWQDGAGTSGAEGRCLGRILEEPAGDGGFGYDPLFFSDDLGCGFGVASREAKERVSHRGRAVRALLAMLSRGR